MKATIFGGGFGLYGYLPALIACHISVILPLRYQSFILHRSDLAPYYPLIDWQPEDCILEQCDAVVMALPPAQQAEMIVKSLQYSNINYFLLEKPLAASPVEAKQVLELMIGSQKKFRIGYHFRCTDWGKKLLQQKQGVENIIWEFHAHHYANTIQTWKRKQSTGGGALRFYGIHLIALLAEMGYTEVLFSKTRTSAEDELESWDAVFGKSGFTECTIRINTRSMNSIFTFEDHGSKYSLTHPFQSRLAQNNAADVRIPYLISTLRELFHDDRNTYEWYEQVNTLWQSTEAFT